MIKVDNKEFFLNKYFLYVEKNIVFTLENNRSDGSGYDLRIIRPEVKEYFPRHTHWAYFKDLYEQEAIKEIPETVFYWISKKND